MNAVTPERNSKPVRALALSVYDLSDARFVEEVQAQSGSLASDPGEAEAMDWVAAVSEAEDWR